MRRKFLIFALVAALLGVSACGLPFGPSNGNDSDGTSGNNVPGNYQPSTGSQSGDEILVHTPVPENGEGEWLPGGNIYTYESTQNTGNSGMGQTVSRGAVADNVFRNDTFKIAFSVGDMTMFSDELMAGTLGIAADLLDESGVISADAMQEALGGVIYDAMFAMSDGTSNFNISYTDMDASGMRLTEEQYLDALEEPMKMVFADFDFGEIGTKTLGGQSYRIATAEIAEGVFQDYLVRVQDNWMVCIICTYTEDSKQLRDNFYDSFIEVQ